MEKVAIAIIAGIISALHLNVYITCMFAMILFAISEYLGSNPKYKANGVLQFIRDFSQAMLKRNIKLLFNDQQQTDDNKEDGDKTIGDKSNASKGPQNVGKQSD